MQMTSVYAPITKSYEQDDGSVLVEGIISDSNLDLDQQRCDPAWLKTAVPTWMAFGNLREQHDKSRAIGRAFEHQDLGDAGHFIRGRVVDSEAVKKVKAGVFNGFSIGVKDYHLSKSADAPNGVIDDGRICEVSLVDYPCNENCRLTMVKSAKPGMKIKASDFDSERMLVRVEEFVEKSLSPDLRKHADSMTVTLADSLSPDQAEALSAKADEDVPEVAEKATDVDNLSAPRPGQTCGNCGESGHLRCVQFDRDAAIALVSKSVANADAGLGQDESGDISGALQAISIIAELIQSEAKDLGTTPAQGCDIDLLMQAVQALRVFNCREAKEQAGIDPGPAPMMLAADADVVKDSSKPYGDVTYADPGYQADKKKRYPLDTKEHAKAAWDFINKAKDAAEYSSEQLKSIKSRIMTACKKFGVALDADAAKKGADVDETVAVDEFDKTVAEDVVDETVEAVEKTIDAPEEPAEEVPADEVVDKTAEPETTKAAVEAVEPDADALVKAVSAALENIFSADELEKADNPIRKTFGAIASAAAESAAKSVSDTLSERLEAVEQMATPGGPALRRTDVQTKAVQRTDLEQQAKYWRDMSRNTTDPDLRKGWATRADEFVAKAGTLGV